MKTRRTMFVTASLCAAFTLGSVGTVALGADRYSKAGRECEEVINDDVKDEFPKAKNIAWDWDSVDEDETRNGVVLSGEGHYMGGSSRRRYDFQCEYDENKDRVVSGWWQSSYDNKRHTVGSGSHGSSGGTSSGQTVYDLRDLVGARAAGAENEMEERGYRWVKTDKSGGSSYSYWREEGTGKCVSVRTADGRYASIVYAPSMDCDGGDDAVDSDDEFDTVCGVDRDGKTYRYRCHLRNEGCKGGGSCKTYLDLPDNSMVIRWFSNNRMEVTFAGMKPESATSSFHDGQTRFKLDDATYFVYRTKDRAERELDRLND